MAIFSKEKDQYQETTIKMPLLITLIALVLMITPFVFWILKINTEGIRATDATKYNTLTATVESTVQEVSAVLRNDSQELESIRASQSKPVITLVVPEVLIVEKRKEEAPKLEELKVELDGIYWSATRPLAGLNGETYQVGDKIQGHEILRIGKTFVHFLAPDGSVVVKDIYERLLQTKK